jgi:hypothetical protein
LYYGLGQFGIRGDASITTESGYIVATTLRFEAEDRYDWHADVSAGRKDDEIRGFRDAWAQYLVEQGYACEYDQRATWEETFEFEFDVSGCKESVERIGECLRSDETSCKGQLRDAMDSCGHIREAAFASGRRLGELDADLLVRPQLEMMAGDCFEHGNVGCVSKAYTLLGAIPSALSVAEGREAIASFLRCDDSRQIEVEDTKTLAYLVGYDFFWETGREIMLGPAVDRARRQSDGWNEPAEGTYRAAPRPLPSTPGTLSLNVDYDVNPEERTIAFDYEFLIELPISTPHDTIIRPGLGFEPRWAEWLVEQGAGCPTDLVFVSRERATVPVARLD